MKRRDEELSDTNDTDIEFDSEEVLNPFCNHTFEVNKCLKGLVSSPL